MGRIIEEKSFLFALRIIQLGQLLKEDRHFVLCDQVVRSGTGIGALVEEAHAAQSRKDFINKMAIASKEARETVYWLRLIKHSDVIQFDTEQYLGEAFELRKMLAAIVKTATENLEKEERKARPSQTSNLKPQT
jgi:four helix bundle protein